MKYNFSQNVTTSKFHLVDLAGSERLKKAQFTEDRLKEGTKANQDFNNIPSNLGGRNVYYLVESFEI